MLAYSGLAMAWSRTEFGVDGFRINHVFGMPFHFFEQTLPWVKMTVREKRGPGASMIWVPEDHNRKEYTTCVGDVIQATGSMGMLQAFADLDIDRVWGTLAAVEFGRECLATGDHDERRGIELFGGNLLAFGNAVMTMQLLGGPLPMLTGDEYE